jgi:hypothetical protein
MITAAQCAAYAGLESSELLLGATPSERHYSLLASYLLNLQRGVLPVRDMIVADLRAFIDLGARQRAADLLLVLRLFLSAYPEARYAEGSLELAGLGPVQLTGVGRHGNVVVLRPRRFGGGSGKGTRA